MARLYLWHWPNPKGQWIRNDVHLPPQLTSPTDVGHATRVPYHGCVNGAIKFVAIVGYNENIDSKDQMIKNWTLSPDLKAWKAGNPLAVSDLWSSKSFRERNLPKVAPSFPVITTTESEVIYVMLNDVDRVPTRNFWGMLLEWTLELKPVTCLGFEPTQSKVLHSTKFIINNVTSLYPELVASEFSAYLLWFKRLSGLPLSLIFNVYTLCGITPLPGGLDEAHAGELKTECEDANVLRRQRRLAPVNTFGWASSQHMRAAVSSSSLAPAAAYGATGGEKQYWFTILQVVERGMAVARLRAAALSLSCGRHLLFFSVHTWAD
ncbi:hypothetical protein HU200_032513 [Digitaria exilis]|uniref:DUF1618 domain-containing protein n=1 Tax=Digitaria exilis TaxID=1010633 RepID=A0A835EQF3_9POAL|nr:hypothetical protein HU200_032513 [Digitaria exilis]